ncbi:MAG TPA: ATP-binding cassette domain-containing protein, partial [Vicinamibacterales bacterium]
EYEMARIGLAERRKHRPSQLSGGQRQRVSVAMACVKKPALLVADEPTASLDEATAVQVRERLHELRKEGTAVVLVSHNQEDWANADRRIVMKLGSVADIVRQGSGLKVVGT